MIKCECTGVGWCNRHRVFKHEHWVRLCQTNLKYFQAWERGYGPGQYTNIVKGTKTTNVLTIPAERKLICEECSHFNNFRCDMIDLGCMNTFIHIANKPNASCPLGLWPQKSS